MKTRLLFGIPAAFVLLFLVLWGASWHLEITALAIAAFAYLEYDGLMFEERSNLRRILMTLLVLGVSYQLGQDHQRALYSFVIAFIAMGVCFLFECRAGQFQRAIRNFSFQLLGLFYISFLFGFLIPIANWPEVGRAYLLYLFLLVFIGDTSAYFAGMKWGKTKLAEQISPNKTVEGAMAAILSAVVITLFWLKFIYPVEVEAQYFQKIIIFAPVMSLLAQMGDLFESALKRSQSQKDSGVFLPGHGGILDRVDGLAFTGPIFYLFIHYVLERH